MQYSKLLFVLLLACLPLAGCDDDTSSANDSDHGTNSPNDAPPEDSCSPETFVESCVSTPDAPDKHARQICQFSSEDRYSKITDIACAEDEICKVYDGKAHCTKTCSDETESVQTCRVDIVHGAHTPVNVEVSCRRFEDGTSYYVEKTSPCNGICYDDKCLSVGDVCDAKTSNKNSVIGCNGSDVYVCSNDQRIHRQFCPEQALCQKTADGYYYCAEQCDKPSSIANQKTCSYNGNRLVTRACTAVSDSANYYISPDTQTTFGNTSKYCKDGALRSYPSSVSCSGKCTELCYGNNAIPWLYTNKFSIIYCGVGKCAHFDDNDGYGYDACMQPCDVEGEEISKCGAYLDTDNNEKRSVFECKRFDNGLYYATVEVESCHCYNGQCI